MIAGLEKISQGNLFIDDIYSNDLAPKDRDIAMFFQNYALYPHKTVFENMAFSLKIRKMDKDEINRRVHEAANILGLQSFLHRKPKALSGGQRQRVALGRAIVRNPKVFLMDEPLSNLDAKLRVQMRTEISKLHQKLQTTTIYVTHDQTEAMTMATRIVIMKDGVIQQIGTPKEVYESPRNLFVAGFIGSPAMNFFDASISEDGFVTIGDTRLKVPADKMVLLRSKGYVNKQLVLGIRPEDLHVKKDFIAANPQTTTTVTVDLAELLGAETYLYSNLNEHTFIARIGPETIIKNGELIELGWNMNHCHFFDKDTDLRI